MLISIVVPTRDRPASLARCLAAIAAQEVEFEVVVVDDGTRDRAEVEVAAGGLDRVRLVRTPGLGPGAARNAGARVASGDVVCFTDDDCEPEPGWAAALAATAVASGTACGRTVAPSGSRAAVLAAQTITSGLQTASLDPVTGRLGFAPSCNLAATREATEALPFDAGFAAPGGEDREWSARAQAAGYAPHYEPGAVVVHRPALGTAGFLRQQVRYGRGASRYRRIRGQERLGSPAFYAELVRSGFASGARVGALVCAAQAAAAAGAGFERARAALN